MQTGTVLDASAEARLALPQRQFQSAAVQVAGVTDGGGKLANGVFNVKGANRLSNRFLVDGMDITDSVANNFSSHVNFDAISSLEVLTGGMEAQYNSLGGVINVNTATGSDKLHIDTSFYIAPSALYAAAQTGPNIFDQERPFSIDPQPVSQSYTANLTVSGPLVKGKLWYSLSLEYDYRQTQVSINPPLNFQHPSYREHDFYPRLKITYAPTYKHRITLSANADPALRYNWLQQTSSANYTMPNADYGQRQGGVFGVLQWDYFISQKLNTNVQAGFNYNTVAPAPMGIFSHPDKLPFDPNDPNNPLGYGLSADASGYNAARAGHYNTLDRTYWYNYGSAFANYKENTYTAQFDPSVSIRGRLWGEHDAKIGWQNRFVVHNKSSESSSFWRDGNPNGLPGERGLCQADNPAVFNDPVTGQPIQAQVDNCRGTTRTDYYGYTNHQWGFGTGIYLQDRWRVNKYLMLLPGIRFDWGITKNSVGQTVSNMWGIGPRIGATVDLTGDQKTIFGVFYGRANETLNLLAASRVADPYVSGANLQWNWSNGAAPGQYRDGYWNLTKTTGPSYQIDPKATAPHADEFDARFMRELFHNSVAGVSYTYKRISNIWDQIEVNQQWDPSGSRVIGYANGGPAKGQLATKYLVTTPDQNYRIYQAVDFTFEARPTSHWDLYAAYTLSWLYGPGADELGTVSAGTSNGAGSPFYNPRQTRFFDGFLPEDQRHAFKLHTSYEWKGLSLGANFAYLSGTPLTKVYWNQNDQSYSLKRTPQGTEPGSAINDPYSTATFRLPDTIELDVRAMYDAYNLIHQHVIVIVDVINVFNTLTPTQLTVADGPNFGLANGARMQPLHAQFALRYQY
jgi:hypothetical protein